MPRKKHKPEEIVAKLRQVDVLLSHGPWRRTGRVVCDVEAIAEVVIDLQ